MFFHFSSPSQTGSESLFNTGPIVLREGENVRMKCAATGHPKPLIEWRMMEKAAIGLGKWRGMYLVYVLASINYRQL